MFNLNQKSILKNEWLYLVVGLGLGYFALPKLINWYQTRNG